MAVGMFIVLAATALLVSTKSGYIAQADSAQVQDTGRFAMEIIARSVRQAAYTNWDPMDGPVFDEDFIDPAIFGMDAKSLKSRANGIASPVAKSINGSDVLAIRFFGAGNGGNDDGTMINCAGFGVGASTSTATAGDDRGWSIFYVAEDSTGEPELYCKYRGNEGWTSQAIARGVESFQVLYGLDTDDDGAPNRLLNAAAIDALDNRLILEGHSAAERATDRKRKSHWRKVVAIKAALLLRGAQVTGDEKLPDKYELFGRDYADTNAAIDPGVRIIESDLPKATRRRERRIFTTTVHLRKRSAGSLE